MVLRSELRTCWSSIEIAVVQPAGARLGSRAPPRKRAQSSKDTRSRLIVKPRPCRSLRLQSRTAAVRAREAICEHPTLMAAKTLLTAVRRGFFGKGDMQKE